MIFVVAAKQGEYVSVQFLNGYAIEKSDDCKYDWLIFQDGPFFFSPIIKRLCGESDSMAPINSTGRYMRMWFRTDDFIQLRGFVLHPQYIPIPSKYMKLFTGYSVK